MTKSHYLLSGIFIATSVTSFFAGAVINDSEILKMDLKQLRSALDRKEFTSEKLVKIYLNQIKENNRSGKNINAVITLNNDALNEAKKWDSQNSDANNSQPLAGIPFLVKDNFNTDGITTTGGSVALSGNRPTTNAFVVQKLLDEGAILIGKTNMSELAASFGWFGYSSFGGQTLNPFNSLRDASGSSSGSAAAVAAHFAPFALGTDTSGSIRAPASVTGNIGLRPTLGLTSRSGVIPLSLTADDVGVITRTVSDQAIVLDAIKGHDLNDAATTNIKLSQYSFSDTVSSGSMKGKKIAIIDNFDGGNPDVDQVKRNAIKQLTSEGAILTHIRLPKKFENLWSLVLGPVGTAEFRPQFNSYLSTLSADQPKNLEEFMQSLSKLTDSGKKEINPARYQGLVENMETMTTDSPQYISILTDTIPSLRNQITGIMKKGNFDAFMFPTMSCPASVIKSKTDPSYVCKSSDPYAASYIASSTGFPEVTVPAGKATGNIPVGISFLGASGDDVKLLQIAYSFTTSK